MTILEVYDTWSYNYPKEIYKTIYFNKIEDLIDDQNNFMIITSMTDSTHPYHKRFKVNTRQPTPAEEILFGVNNGSV